MSTIQRDAILPLKSDAYASFDPLSLKEYFKQRLNQSGIFTEQNTEGSNLAVLNDFMSMAFGSLLFYLNRSATDGMFTETDIYENMNRIVKLNDYNPQGYHSASLNFSLSATADLSPGVYVIPKYSYVNVVGDINYSFATDVTIVKSTTSTEFLSDTSTQQLLYQGKFREYPLITANGDSNELLFLIPDSDTKIDHFNIHVYVKRNGETAWERWQETPSHYLEKSTSKKYEIRFNENQRYELRFGDDINSAKLNTGDQISIFYLSTLAEDGEVGAGSLNGSSLIPFNSLTYSAIIANLNTSVVLTDSQYAYLEFSNNFSSTYSSNPETVDQIRKNAPKAYRSQYRLVTAEDFTNFVKTNFANIIQDAVVVDNDAYLNGYMKRMYNYGIMDPSRESRALLNQVQFADACNFNNAYIFVVPKQINNSTYNSYLTVAQKQLILNTIANSKAKVHTVEPIIMDPVYIAFDIGVPKSDVNVQLSDSGNAELIITKNRFSRVDNSSIINRINNIITDYFSRKNMALGSSIDILELNRQILAIDGVSSFRTRRTDDPNIFIEGLCFISSSEVYGTPTKISSRFNLESFEFAYLKQAPFPKIKIENDGVAISNPQY
jgi:hypothetical protein